MRWNNKKRKIFIFIVSLLIILQIFSVLGLAEGFNNLLNDLKPPKPPEDDKEETKDDENNSTGDGSKDDGGSDPSNDNTWSSGSGTTSPSNTGSSSSSSPSTSTYSSNSDLGSSDALPLDQDKYDKYATSLAAYSPSDDSLNIEANLIGENLVELKLTGLEGKSVDGTIYTLGATYSTDDGLAANVDVSRVEKYADQIFVSAETPTGDTSVFKYVDIKPTNNEGSESISINNEAIRMFSKIFVGISSELRNLLLFALTNG